MNSHENAGTTHEGRKLLMALIGGVGLMAAAGAASAGQFATHVREDFAQRQDVVRNAAKRAE